MSVILSDGTTDLHLDPDLFWSDEFSWNPVEQSATRSITGANIIQAAGMVSGRPITLAPEDNNSAWESRQNAEQLRNWAAVPGLVLTLTLRGVTRSVIFRHQDGGFEATPVIHYRDMVPMDFYRVTIRLMEI